MAQKSAAEIIAEARKRNPVGGVATKAPEAPAVELEPAPSIEDCPAAIRPIVEAIKPYVSPNIKPERLRALVDDAVLRLLPKPLQLEFKDGEGELKKIETAHRQLPDLIKKVRRFHAAGRGVFLTGPAGSAKTTASAQVAEILGRDFYCMSIGPQTSKADLLGYMDAHGRYVETILYRAYRDGGVFLFDELDAGTSGVLTIINALTSQPFFIFPNGERVSRHPDFLFMGAGNTYGTGANLQYVGRNALDGATMDRFRPMLWDYDPELEKALAIRAATAIPNGHEAAAGMAVKWAARVQTLRAAAEKANVRLIISTRAVISGAAALADGDSWEQTEQAEIWREGGVTRDDRERILSHV